MSDPIDLPCLPAAPTIGAAPSGLFVPHEVFEEKAYSVIVPTAHGLITLDVAIANRCLMLASGAYSGEGWRHIQYGAMDVAIKAREPIVTDPSDRTSPGRSSESDLSA